MDSLHEQRQRIRRTVFAAIAFACSVCALGGSVVAFADTGQPRSSLPGLPH